jgi:hypothetical protein
MERENSDSDSGVQHKSTKRTKRTNEDNLNKNEGSNVNRIDARSGSEEEY